MEAVDLGTALKSTTGWSSGIGTDPLSVEGLTPGLYHLIVQFGEGEARGFRLMKE